MADKRLLVVLDGSAVSKRAVKYVASLISRRRGFRLCLVHVLPPLPPRLLEHGGSENPATERRLENELRLERERWVSSAKSAAQKHVDDARTTFRKNGVPAASIQTLFCDPGEGRNAADDILRMAGGCKCRTIVVGRQAVSWFHELFSQELPEELLRRGKGFSIWIIE